MATREEYLIAKYELKENFEQVFSSSTDDNCISSLKRLRKFFNENVVIESIIEDLTKNKKALDLDDFLVRYPHNMHFSVKVPEDIGIHILTMNELIDFICNRQNKTSTLGVYLIPSAKSNSIIDIIQNFLSEVFLPLYKYLNKELEKRLIIMGETRNGNIIVNQTISGNGNNVSIAGRDSFVNGEALKEVEVDLKSLIDKALNELSNTNINQEEKEELADDLDVLNTEINAEKPNVVKFRKVKKSIDSFISGFDETLKKSTGLIATLTSIGVKITELISN